jgi:hypothetical protein
MENASEQAKVLAEAYSKQSKYSNQLWLALIGAAVVVNFPHRTASEIDLPLSLGSVQEGIFAPAAFLILTVLTVAYCAAFAGADNANRFAHGRLDNQERRLFDFLSVATFARVAPLVDSTIHLLKNSPCRNKIAAIYYVFLKLVANVIILGIPTASLITAYFNLLKNKLSTTAGTSLSILLTLAMVVTVVAIVQIAIVEFSHNARIARLFWYGDAGSQ